MVCFRDAQIIIRFSYREPVQKTQSIHQRVRAETGESVGKINGFSSKVSLSGCTMHTHIHTISQIHTPVIMFHLHSDN